MVPVVLVDLEIIQTLNFSIYSGLGHNKRGKRLQTSQGLTQNIKYVQTRKTKLFNSQLNSETQYWNIPSWVKNLEEYFSVIGEINHCYKKMLEIGQCQEVF
jgi:hypothetical protein